MSRLPDPHEKCDSAEKIHSVVMTEPMPILASQIAKATEGDKELATVLPLYNMDNGHLGLTTHLLCITTERMTWQWLTVALLGAGG